MKTVIFAAALLLGTAAVAQDAAQDTTADTATSTTTGTADTGMQSDTTAQTAPAQTQPMQSTAPMQSAPPMQSTPTTVAAGNTTPERDARGIAVVSDSAMAPAGANQMAAGTPGARMVPSPNQAAVFATQPSTKEYPVCSRTVTDGCVQSYEGGRRRR